MTEAVNNEQGSVKLERQGAVAVLILSRTHALNAITWEMYKQFQEYLQQLAEDSSVRALVIRGDGEKALAAGTDISQFEGFTGADGIAYEKRIDKIIDELENFPKPTIAAVHGYAVGGGMMISATCDLRYGTPDAQFGAPMARTLGNCLSLANYQRLDRQLGSMVLKDLLFTSRLLKAEEALSRGFLTAIFDQENFFDEVMAIAERISKNAPLTIEATKEALNRIHQTQASALDEDSFDDVVSKVYGSDDFAEGVKAYMEKRKPNWQGK
ncbi:enoyl-CoA hydratase [Alkalihalobacillus oceani]|uniref:Enoyl-CoA hydratase n=1 Tax=Halalkalibacter oceani TaxID=1653776 RepID=A0A9X2IQG5_9BACI|nr:enoyl-CoA hydratase [Halalkalibacter oceani]MCM3714563.1 enoyl-CoA hydratase [Halalkalibacter oceani]